MSASEVKASDVLSHLDEVVSLTRRARAMPGPYSPEFMDGYLRALTDFRRYVRSQDFPHIVAITKETSNNAPRP